MSGRLILIVVLSLSGCRLGRGGPDFERFSSSDELSPPGEHVRAGELELFVKQCTVGGTFTALGRDNRQLSCVVTVINHGRAPYHLPMSATGEVSVHWKSGVDGAFMMPLGPPWIDTREERSLPPGATGDTRVTCTGGSYDEPLEIVFRGVAMRVDR